MNNLLLLLLPLLWELCYENNDLCQALIEIIATI